MSQLDQLVIRNVLKMLTRLHIKMPNCRIVTIFIECNRTVADLKQMLCDVTTTPNFYFRLLRDG